ncbi:aminopeptidase N [soil metagenome]
MSSGSQSLQHGEALARFDLVSVTSYDVSLDLASDEATFGSVTTVTFESTGGPTFVDLKPARVNALRFNDATLDPDLLDRGRLPLDTVAGTNVLVVDAVMPFRNDGEGLHRSVDPADGRHYVYGMSFMDAAPTIFACFDQPDLKAPYTLHVRAPRDWVVIGNAPADNPEPGRWELGPTQPLSTYFVTLVAGPYQVLTAEHAGIALGLSSRASLAPALEKDAEELFTLTRQSFDELHRLFGIRYPFGDYHQAFVPEFNAGAMENPGCVTFRDQLLFDTRVTRGQHILRATTIAHEMAHQWFGNITTPKWWDDLWLNESFAEYMGNRVTADVTEFGDAWTHVAWSRRQWGLTADQRPSTHPVAGNGAADAVAALQNFDGISYAKGSSILKQLATTLGDDVFFAGAIDHFDTHFYGNATMHDLFASWEKAGAGDLSPVIDQWLRTAGPDTFTIDRERGLLLRTPPASAPADRAHALQVGSLGVGSYAAAPVSVTGAETALAHVEGALVIDPAEQSWGVYVPDAETMRALVAALPTQRDPLLRAATWNNVKSGFSVAAVDPDDVVDLLVAALPVEDTEDTGRHTVPWVLREVLPAASTGSAERVLAAARARLAQEPPASELQLSSFRIVVHLSTDVDELSAWRGGTDLPDGIALDPDVSWRLLTRLATLGATDQAALDAALADDATTFTQVQHSRASASLPTAAAKAAAWATFTGEVDVPNYELEAAGAGLWRGGQEAVTAPYVERYFADLPKTAEVRSGWVLALSSESFFPRSSVTPQTLDRCRALLDSGVLEPAVARRVVDQQDALERALAVRAAFPKQ